MLCLCLVVWFRVCLARNRWDKVKNVTKSDFYRIVKLFTWRHSFIVCCCICVDARLSQLCPCSAFLRGMAVWVNTYFQSKNLIQTDIYRVCMVCVVSIAWVGLVHIVIVYISYERFFLPVNLCVRSGMQGTVCILKKHSGFCCRLGQVRYSLTPSLPQPVKFPGWKMHRSACKQ